MRIDWWWAWVVFALLSSIQETSCGKVAHAEDPRPGFAAYAAMAPRWPCDDMMAGSKDLPALRLSVLWNSFGTSFACLDKWAADPRPKALEVHLINEVCARNNRCGPYEFHAGMKPDGFRAKLLANDKALRSKLVEHITPIAQWFVAHQDVACYVSPGLESNLDPKSFQTFVEWLKPSFPARCSFVYNPAGINKYGTKPIPGLIREVHGSKPNLRAPCIMNLDGEDIALNSRPALLAQVLPASDLPRYFSSAALCDVGFLWIAESNGINRGGFIDPRKRTNFPSAKTFEELRGYMLHPAGVPVPPWDSEDEKSKAGCKTMLKAADGAKRGFLWKQSDTPGRGAVALLPQPKRFKAVTVLKRGKEIERLTYAYQYTEDGSNRQTWRAKRKAVDFPYNVVLKADSSCYVLKNPKIRND